MSPAPSLATIPAPSRVLDLGCGVCSSMDSFAIVSVLILTGFLDRRMGHSGSAGVAKRRSRRIRPRQRSNKLGVRGTVGGTTHNVATWQFVRGRFSISGLTLNEGVSSQSIHKAPVRGRLLRTCTYSVNLERCSGTQGACGYIV